VYAGTSTSASQTGSWTLTAGQGSATGTTTNNWSYNGGGTGNDTAGTAGNVTDASGTVIGNYTTSSSDTGNITSGGNSTSVDQYILSSVWHAGNSTTPGNWTIIVRNTPGGISAGILSDMFYFRRSGEGSDYNRRFSLLDYVGGSFAVLNDLGSVLTVDMAFAAGPEDEAEASLVEFRESLVAEDAQAAATARNTGATFGSSASTNYRATFFAVNPDLEGQVVVHHAVEQQVLNKFPGVVTQSQIHSLENLRGIPYEANSDVHLSQIRIEWNRFYKPFIESGTSPTLEQLLQKATEIDARLGSQFRPPVGG
jgi:hypothetical protein